MAWSEQLKCHMACENHSIRCGDSGERRDLASWQGNTDGGSSSGVCSKSMQHECEQESWFSKTSK
jgi:hypothetical protein